MKHYTRFFLCLVFLLILLSESSRVFAQGDSLPIKPVKSQEIVIDMESYTFTPSEIRIARDQTFTIILRNHSFLVPHNFLLDDPNGVRLLEVDISSGESQSHVLKLTEGGNFPFYCDKQLLFFPTHREEGMEGRFIVP